MTLLLPSPFTIIPHMCKDNKAIFSNTPESVIAVNTWCRPVGFTRACRLAGQIGCCGRLSICAYKHKVQLQFIYRVRQNRHNPALYRLWLKSSHKTALISVQFNISGNTYMTYSKHTLPSRCKSHDFTLAPQK